MECGDDGYILLCGIYGEIEGHEKLPVGVKSTSYEDLLPAVAQAENCREIKGVLVLINTVGGDVESGLAISEMFASLSKAGCDTGAWRGAFYRSPSGNFRRCLIYSSDRDYGGSSYTDEHCCAWREAEF